MSIRGFVLLQEYVVFACSENIRRRVNGFLREKQRWNMDLFSKEKEMINVRWMAFEETG